MTETWVIKNKKGDVEAIAKEQNVLPVTAKLLLNRDLTTKEERDAYLHPSFSGLRKGTTLLNADKAAEMIKAAIVGEKKIRIIGDYDVDGITSTYILYRTLKESGADVSYAIPNRITDGYGINENIVDDAHADGIDMILTCDNGISEFDTIKHARELGMQVVVTDHHEVPKDENGDQVLPPADVVVNPHQTGETAPFTGICGCVVAMKVLEAMGANVKPLLPYAAMATLCDVMEVVEENRTIVVLGLAGLRMTTDVGLLALIEANSLLPMKVTAYHIGFVIGPCLNASGRLDTAEKALRVLLQNDRDEALDGAKELVELNNDRKAMTEAGTRRAETIIETIAKKRAEMQNDEDWEKYIDKVIIVYLKECHESIAGIIAGRLREKYYRPVFVLTNSGDIVKGSGRSTENWSMYENLCKVGDILLRFGGHPMAAGLSLSPDMIDEFQRRLLENCTLTDADLVKKVKIDMMLPFEYMSPRLTEEIEMLEPFGKGNEKALFGEKNVKVTRASIVGKAQNVLRLDMVTSTGFRAEGVYFGDIPAFTELIEKNFGRDECDRMFKGRSENVTISLIYVPYQNFFGGILSMQARIVNIKVLQ